MTEREIEKFLEAQGIAYSRPVRDGVETLRLLDVSQLPSQMRERFDSAGYYMAPTEASTGNKEGAKTK